MAGLTVDFFSRVSAQRTTQPAAVAAVLEAVRRHAVRIPDTAAAAAGSMTVSAAEVQQALRHTASGKSPGPDGIPAELWRWAGPVVHPILAAVFTAAGEVGWLPPRFNVGAVVPLFKAGDPALLQNYRPITLLNSDYRLLAKVLAGRWGAALGPCVAREQTAFLPGRHIGETVLLLQLMPAVLQAQGSLGAAVFLDFRKAYDTVDRDFLFAVMETVGAGGGMLRWARMLLADTQAVAVVNGHASAPRLWLAGVRQGCPLAPAMYLFVAWALTCWLRATPAVGVTLGGERVVAGQYADDTTPFLPACDTHHMASLVVAMSTFEAASGQGLNLDKCMALPLGSPQPEPVPDRLAGIQVVGSASTLGMRFSNTADPLAVFEEDVDWAKLLDRVLVCFKRLAALPLSAFGRALAASGYGVSKLLYHAEFAAVPAGVLTRLSKAAALLVDRGVAPGARLQPGQRLPGVLSGLLAGHPGSAGMGLLPWREHVTARQAVWGQRLVRGLLGIRRDGQLLTGGGEANLPPWILAARVVLQHALPTVHPALALLQSPHALPPGPLSRMAAALAQIGRSESAALAGTPGPWCADQPLWSHPALALELPFQDRPAAYRAQMVAHEQSRPAEAPVHEGVGAVTACQGLRFLRLVPGLRVVGDLVALVRRVSAGPCWALQRQFVRHHLHQLELQVQGVQGPQGSCGHLGHLGVLIQRQQRRCQEQQQQQQQQAQFRGPVLLDQQGPWGNTVADQMALLEALWPHPLGAVRREVDFPDGLRTWLMVAPTAVQDVLRLWQAVPPMWRAAAAAAVGRWQPAVLGRPLTSAQFSLAAQRALGPGVWRVDPPPSALECAAAVVGVAPLGPGPGPVVQRGAPAALGVAVLDAAPGPAEVAAVQPGVLPAPGPAVADAGVAAVVPAPAPLPAAGASGPQHPPGPGPAPPSAVVPGLLVGPSVSVRACTHILTSPRASAARLRCAAAVRCALVLAAHDRPVAVCLRFLDEGGEGAPAAVRVRLRSMASGEALSRGVSDALGSLFSRLSEVWRLPWENSWKEVWWRLLLHGVPGAGGHDVGQRGPCPCGWRPPDDLPLPLVSLQQRDHAFWVCPVAVAVRRLLQHFLPSGVVVQPCHLWLLTPPHPSVHAGVWVVVGLAALTALDRARRYMWSLRLAERRAVAGLLTSPCSLPVALCVGGVVWVGGGGWPSWLPLALGWAGRHVLWWFGLAGFRGWWWWFLLGVEPLCGSVCPVRVFGLSGGVAVGCVLGLLGVSVRGWACFARLLPLLPLCVAIGF